MVASLPPLLLVLSFLGLAFPLYLKLSSFVIRKTLKPILASFIFFLAILLLPWFLTFVFVLTGKFLFSYFPSLQIAAVLEVSLALLFGVYFCYFAGFIAVALSSYKFISLGKNGLNCMNMNKFRTLGNRLIAVIVDMIVLYPLTYLEIFQSNNKYGEISASTAALASVAITCAYFIYFAYAHGATLGKMVSKVKIVSVENESKISLKQAVIREFPFVFCSLALLISRVVVNGSFVISDNTSDTEIIIGAIVGAWILGCFMCALINSKSRALHDFMAGTVVVKTSLVSKA